MARKNKKTRKAQVQPVTRRWTSGPAFRWGRWGLLLVLGGILYAGARPATPIQPAASVKAPPLVVATDDNDVREQEHLPNNDPFQKRPIFLPKINVTDYFQPPEGHPMPAHCWPDIAVDSRNISHVTWMATAFAQGGGGPIGHLPQGSHNCSMTEAPAMHALGAGKIEALPIGSKWKVLMTNPGTKQRVVGDLKVKQDPDDAQCQLWYIAFPDKDIQGQPVNTESGGHWHVYPPHPMGEDKKKKVEGFTRCQLRAGDGGGLMLFEFCFAFDSVYYNNDRYETRKANSFATSFCLAGIHLGENTAFHPEMAVDSGDSIHVVFSTFHPYTGQIVLAYRRFDRASNSWIPTIFPEEGPSTPMPGDLAHLEVDSANIAHIVFIKILGQVTELRYTKATTAAPSLGSHFTPSELIVGSGTGWGIKLDKPRLSIGTDNIPHVAHIMSNGGVQTMWYTNRAGGAWQAPVNISAGNADRDCDLAVFGTNVVHFVWDETNTNGIFYRKRTAGVNGNIKQVNETTAQTMTPRIVADSRGNLRGLANFGLNQQLYFAKVKRPKDSEMGELSNKDKWGRREPIEIDAPWDPDFNSMELALNQNDNLYTVHGNEVVPGFECSTPIVPIWFSHEFEPNLGSQDSFAMYPWGPNTTANALNGNMMHTLPIFSSKGVGFSTNFTLFYNSQKWNKSSLAPGWMHNYHATLTKHNILGGSVLNLVFGDGHRVVYFFDGGANRYLQMENYFAEFSSIVENGTSRDGEPAPFLWQDKFGMQMVFNAQGKLLKLVDTQAAPNTLVLTYQDNTESVDPTETNENGVLALKITDSATRETLLAYDELDRLKQVTDPAGGLYSIQYEPGQPLKGKISKVTFPQQSPVIEHKFEYHASNSAAAGQKTRINLISKVITPRGSLEGYSFDYRHRQDNATLACIYPEESMIKDDADIDAPVVLISNVDDRKRAFNYAWMPWKTRNIVGFEIEKPNTVTPNNVNRPVDVRYEPEEDPAVDTTINVTGNNVPKVHFKDMRDSIWKMEYQYTRCLVDNQIDPNPIPNPDANFVRRWFNGSVSGAPDSQPTFRNLTVFVDKRGVATKYEFHMLANPSEVKNNLAKVHRAKKFDNINDPPGDPGFLPAIEYTYTNDGLNRLETGKDSKGNTTTLLYDPAGNNTDIVHPTANLANGTAQSAINSSTFDTRGRLTASIPAEHRQAGATTLSDIDEKTGIHKSVQRPGGTKTDDSSFDKLGNALTAKMPEGGTYSSSLDPLYRPTNEVMPPGDAGTAQKALNYDADSNLEEVHDPITGGTTKTKRKFDRWGRVTEITQRFDNPQSKTMKLRLDREGNARKVEDFNQNLISQKLFDSLYRLIEQQGNISSTIDPGDVFTRALWEYDSNGNLTKTVLKGVSSPDDRIWDLTYDQLNRRDTAINPDTTIDDNDFDENDLLIKAVHMKPGGGMFSGEEEPAPPVFLWGTSLTYDERNRTKTSTQMTDGQGNGFTTKYIPDKDGDIIQVIDPLGNRQTNVYDVRKRLKQVLDCEDSVVVEYEYDEDDRQIAVKRPDPNSNEMITVQRTVYNLKGEVKEVYDASNNRVALNTYDIAGNLIETIDVDGVKTKYTYDDLNRMIQTVMDEGAGRLNLMTMHVYDDNGNRIQTSDPRNKIYKFVYDKGDQLEKIEYPALDATAQHFERWKYNVFGQQNEYQVGHQQPGNPPTNIVISRKSTFTYDTSGRMNEEKHDLDNNGTFETTVTRTYTDAGPLNVIDDGTIKLDFDYDSLNRVTLVSWYYQGALFKTVGASYDEASNKKTMTGPEGDITEYGYDNNNRLVSLHRNKDGVRTLIQSIEYDRGSRRKKVILGNGLASRYFYNSRDEMVAMRTFNASAQLVHSIAYQYRADGNRSQVDFEHLNLIARFEYDAVDRLTGEVWTGNICNEFQNALASNIGNESTGFSPAGTVTPVAILAVQPHYQFYAYDANGNRTSLTGISRSATYEYDNENRLTLEHPTAPVKMTGTTASASDTETGFTANRINDGDTGEATDPACAWKSQDTAVTHTADITWSTAENITQVRVFIPGGGAQRFKIQYLSGTDWVNATVQNVIGAQQVGTSEWYQTFNHVSIFAISSVSTTGIRFVQDAGGGPVAQPNVAMLNELEAYKPLTQSDVTYTYDDHGNQLSRTQGTTVEEFGYDYANRLNLYKKTINSVLDTHFTYRATPTGDRFQKINVLAPTQEERYVSDGRDVVADYFICGGQFRVKNTYVQGLGIDTKIARFETTYSAPPACISTELSPLYYLGDALGTVTNLANSTGQITDTFVSNAWGEHQASIQVNVERYGFTQREQDSESSRMHYRIREYDPRISRFLQKDPINERKLMEHYRYAGNQPTGLVDPTGEKTEIVKVPGKKVMIVITYVAVHSSEEWWESESSATEDSFEIARKLSLSVHNFWNNKGNGWDVTITKGPGIGDKPENWTVYFLPRIVAVSQRVLRSPMFKGYDGIEVRGHHRVAHGGVTGSPWTPETAAKYKGTPIPEPGKDEELYRQIVPDPSQQHVGWFASNIPQWKAAHEFGHLLGTADRYIQNSQGAVSTDDGWKDSIMGGRFGTPAGEIDIIEWGQLSGYTIKSAQPGSVQRFKRPEPVGYVTEGIHNAIRKAPSNLYAIPTWNKTMERVFDYWNK